MVGTRKGSGTTGLNSVGNQQFVAKNDNEDGTLNITIPSTKEAKQYEGWGTALKPASPSNPPPPLKIKNFSFLLGL